MTQYLIQLLLDDTIAVQSTLLGQIQAQLPSIASNTQNPPPAGFPAIPVKNIEVRKIG